MLDGISKKIFEKYFAGDNYKNLEKIDKRLRSFYINPISGKLIRKILSSQINSFLKKRDFKMVKAINMALNKIELESGLTELISMPVIAHFNLTSKCNLRCIMCFQTHNEDMERLHMPSDIFEKVSGTLFPFLKTIKMDASGEALLHPDFKQVIRLLDKHDIELQMTTNGMLLKEETSDELLAMRGLKHFCVSFDAATPEIFEAIRFHARYDRVYRNFEYFCKKRRELNRDDITVGIAFTALRQNIEHLPKLVELAHEWGMNVIYVAYAFISGTSDTKWSLYFSQDLANRIFDEASELSSRLGVGIHLPSKFGQTDAQTWRKCSWAWSSVYIHPNGIVGPCCVIQYFTQTDDGRHLTDKRENSLVQKTFKQIWNGDSFRKLRETVNAPNPSYFHCKNSCPVFGRGKAAELHKHFDSSLYPDEEALTQKMQLTTEFTRE